MGHDSDCAVHSEPAYPAGECNCSACDELHKLRADLAAAQRELAAWQRVVDDLRNRGYGMDADGLDAQHAHFMAQEGVSAQPQYREPTLEDVIELRNCNLWGAPKWLDALKQLGFYRKVQP